MHAWGDRPSFPFFILFLFHLPGAGEREEKESQKREEGKFDSRPRRVTFIIQTFLYFPFTRKALIERKGKKRREGGRGGKNVHQRWRGKGALARERGEEGERCLHSIHILDLGEKGGLEDCSADSPFLLLGKGGFRKKKGGKGKVPLLSYASFLALAGGIKGILRGGEGREGEGRWDKV